MQYSDILLAADFDRTMTGTDTSVPQRNLEAIRYFSERGGKFALDTGRSVGSLGAFLKELPRDVPSILYTGSAMYQNGKLTQIQTISWELRDMLQTMGALFPDMELQSQGAQTDFLFDPTPETVAMYRGMGWQYTLADPDTDVSPFMKFSLFGHPDYPAVSSLYGGTPEQIRRFDEAEALLREKFSDKVTVYRAAPRIIDMHAVGVSKIGAARRLQKMLGCKVLVCVGDGKNDIGMLSGADHAFCPADGEIAAQYETVCACDDGAVADVIYEKIPAIPASQP